MFIYKNVRNLKKISDNIILRLPLVPDVKYRCKSLVPDVKNGI